MALTGRLPPPAPVTPSVQSAYQTGVVLVRCPGCTNLHLVADHLGYFEDGSVDVESLLAQRGEAVRSGRLEATSPTHDRFVCELSEADVAVLATLSKSVSMKTGEEVRSPRAARSDGEAEDGALREGGDQKPKPDV